ADIVAQDDKGRTPLHLAAMKKKNSVDVATLLIERGADIVAKDDKGRTPLHYATKSNSLEIARLLIQHGANTDGIDLSWMEDQEDGS
ncbi:MAG: hypothetical protein CL783_00440, partial [Chloroflexi bacterium]|nr:hypothetical protein [Chloroflexota bacterium]